MSINRPKESPLYKWTHLIYTEVFRRINVKLVIVTHPMRRASEEIVRARVDGEPARIYAYGESFPNLIRIEEPIFHMTVAAYKADSSVPELKGWESLRNTEYFIEYPRGMVASEKNLSKVVKAEKLSDIRETYLGVQRLANKRIDIYIDDANSVIPIIRNKEYNFQGKIHLAGIMEEVPLYMYVHQKHKMLAKELVDVIRDIKSEGLVTNYYNIAFGINTD